MEEDLRARRLLYLPGRPDVIEVGMGQGDRDGLQPVLSESRQNFFGLVPRVDDERLPRLGTADDRAVDFEQTDRKRLNDKAVLSRAQSPSNGLRRFAERHYSKRPVPISTRKGLPSQAPEGNIRPAMPRAIIFDFNGILADDEEVHFLMFQRVLGEEGILLAREKYYGEYLGYDDRGCFRAACLAAGRMLSDEDLADLIERKSAYYTAHVAGHDVLYPGAVEAVWRMSGRYALAVVSGALRNEIDGILERAGLRSLFRVVVAAEDVSAGKPDPEGFVRALAKLNEKQTGARPLQPEECLVIEDSHAGIEAARRAGMPVLAIAHTYPAESLRDADDVIPSISDLTIEAVERPARRNA